MKRLLHLSIVTIVALLFCQSAYSQSVYWREGFTTWDGPTGDPGTTSAFGTATGEAGLWGYYGIWRTTGTGCAYADGTLNPHIRSTSSAITSTTTPTDTAFLITPEVNNGISAVSIIRSRTNRRLSVYWTPDASVTTSNWIFAVASVKSAGSPVATCTDTLFTINQPTARRLQLRFERATNSDVDSIVLYSSTTLPISFTNVKASPKLNGIQVEWSNATEANLSKYVIERSADGRTFAEVATVAASGNRNSLASYSWYDASPLGNNNFYRIKGVEKDGTTMYTTILKVNSVKGNADFVIAPNPIKGTKVNLQLANLSKGLYTVSVFSSNGQQMFTNTINNDGGSSTYQFQLPASVKSGLYNIQIKQGETVLNKKLVVE